MKHCSSSPACPCLDAWRAMLQAIVDHRAAIYIPEDGSVPELTDWTERVIKLIG